jgi:ABC-2 type transport system ATP-binding protein
MSQAVAQQGPDHALHSSAQAAATPLIEAEHLVKHYGATEAVRDVSFRVHRGEVVGFLGPNGAGKSTTMKMLTGFLRPTRGRARIMGIDMAEDALEAQRHIGYLPESAPLYDDMMVVDFLSFVADLRGIVGARRRTQLRSVVEQCGLGDVLGKDIAALSKGFRQRVGLAQALLDDADLLILDEPTSGLDPNQIVEIRALIRQLGRDKTVLLSTHILSEVQAVCNRAIIINQGTLVADAAPDKLAGQLEGSLSLAASFRARPGAEVDRTALLAAVGNLPMVQRAVPAPAQNARDAAFAVTGQGDEGALREAVFDLAIAHELMLVDLHRNETSLEETFQRLTGAQQQAGEGRHAA